MRKIEFFIMALLSCLFFNIEASGQGNGNGIMKSRQQEFAKWKYGAFLHFNMGTFHDKEWVTGYEDPLSFNPTSNIDCNQWMKVIKAVGMKYAVLTVKHTGGWCLWDSKYTTHDIASFKNYKNGKGDIVRDFVNACRKHGIKVGFYYCMPGDYSGNSLNGRTDLHGLPLEAQGDYSGFIKKQMTELLTNYGKIDLLWVDQTQNRYTAKDWVDLLNTIHGLQPGCVVVANNEHSYEKTDVCSYEYNYFKKVDMNQALPKAGNGNVSEVSDCIDATDRWFWHTGEKGVKSVDAIVGMLRMCNELSTNYLLDIPAGRDGKISPLYSNQLKNIWKKYTGK